MSRSRLCHLVSPRDWYTHVNQPLLQTMKNCQVLKPQWINDQNKWEKIRPHRNIRLPRQSLKIVGVVTCMDTKKPPICM